MSKRPIICVDFDGVLHSYTSGWQGAGVANDPPVDGACEWLEEVTKHYRVAIYSSRSKSLAGRACMKRYARQHFNTATGWSGEHRWDFLYEELEWPWFKPSALITLDDRAICFDGTFPTIETIRGFKPWNKH